MTMMNRLETYLYHSERITRDTQRLLDALYDAAASNVVPQQDLIEDLTERLERIILKERSIKQNIKRQIAAEGGAL